MSIKNLFFAVVSGLLIGSSAQADAKDYLKDFPAGSTPQEGALRVVENLLGRKFLWEPVKAVKKAGCDMLYIAMFDEVDEGTAVFKCTNEPPAGDGVPFLTYEGLPGDHYSWFAGQAGRLLRNEITITRNIPERSN